MQSFHPGETRARCFQSIGNRVKRSETSAVAFHFIPDPVRAGSAPSSSSSRAQAESPAPRPFHATVSSPVAAQRVLHSRA